MATITAAENPVAASPIRRGDFAGPLAEGNQRPGLHSAEL